jgi:hypothetical protein
VVADKLACIARANTGSLSRSLGALLLAGFIWGVSAVAVAQTQIPLPGQTSTFTGNVRGYWFTSPSNIVIRAVEVPTDASTGAQSIAVVRLPVAPPLFSATTNTFDSLFLTQNNPAAGQIPVTIPIAQGEIVGVLGQRATVGSYATAPVASTIDGQAVTLNRLGMQFALTTTAPQQLWTETGGSISRVFIYYDVGILVQGVADPLAGGTVTCPTAAQTASTTASCTAAANPGFVLQSISGCGGTPSSTSPYTTGSLTTHCTVTATFVPAVTVGGAVSGLTGSGLALSLNGSETLPIAADGSFTFTSTVASGGSYNVTVQTQPSSPTQTCTVTNGSGTAGASNITNVAVACTTNTYSVGGNVSGLAGSGLVLSLNSGAQTLNVSADGNFTFPAALASGSAYAVSVQTQPSAPTQNCTVGSGSGTVTNANVTNVVVTCSTNNYSVGGSVSGLAGSGLVLSLNAGAQTLNVSTNGNFTFPTALASGATYAVTVQTQPSAPTQSCTVASGSGTVTASNVVDIAVSCTTNTYSIGGNVSGLSGSGLLLSLNGGAQTLAVSTSGSFAFATPLASGAAYAVTVQTQPSSPAQICSVTSGTGTVAAGNVTDVSVQCAAQARAVTLTSNLAAVSTTPPIPSSVADGSVLSFSLNVQPGFTLLGVSGCGGTLTGSTYTTAPITADCSIAVNLAAEAVSVVPTLDDKWLATLSLALIWLAAFNRRRVRKA